jgi:hypothetical protein
MHTVIIAMMHDRGGEHLAVPRRVVVAAPIGKVEDAANRANRAAQR